jgi:hypothetical protein
LTLIDRSSELKIHGDGIFVRQRIEIGNREIASPFLLGAFEQFAYGTLSILVEPFGKVAFYSRADAAARKDGATFPAAIGRDHIVDVVAVVMALGRHHRDPAQAARINVEHGLAVELWRQGAEGKLRSCRIQIYVKLRNVDDGVIEIRRREFGERVFQGRIDDDKIGRDALGSEQCFEQRRVRLAIAVPGGDDRLRGLRCDPAILEADTDIADVFSDPIVETFGFGSGRSCISYISAASFRKPAVGTAIGAFRALSIAANAA